MNIKLTKLSKTLITFTIGILIAAITYICLSFYNVKTNQFLLNTKTGKVITKKGINFSYYFSTIKDNYACQELVGGAIIQDKSRKNYGFMFSVIYQYDLNWIEKNKCIPKHLIIPDYKFKSYMLNSSSTFTIEDVYNREKLVDILKYFYENALKNSGYKIEGIYITSPIIEVNLPYNIK